MRGIKRNHGPESIQRDQVNGVTKNKIAENKGRTQNETGITIGANSLVGFKGDLSIPMDRFHLSLSGIASEQEGGMENTIKEHGETDRHIQNDAGRLKLRFLASDSLDISIGLVGKRTEKFMFPFRRTPRNSLVKKGLFPADEKYKYSQDFEGSWENNYWSFILNVDTQFSLGTFTSITGYREFNVDKLLDSDFSPLDMGRKNVLQNDDTLTQEFRLASKASESPFQWLTGFSYFKKGAENHTTAFYRSGMSGNIKNPFGLNTGSRLDFSDQTNRGAALFGRAAIKIHKEFNVTLGLRYEVNGVHMHQVQTDFLDHHSPLSKTFPDTFETYAAMSPSAGLEWLLTENHIFYASFSGGYRSGGFNKMASNGYTSYDEETTRLYELGTKFTLPCQRLSINLCGFYMDIRNEQVLRYDSNQLFPCIVNAEKSHRMGLEMKIRYRPLPGLDFLCGLGILEAEYDRYTDQSLGVDYKGNKVSSVPEYSIKVGIKYRYPLQGQWKVLGNVDFSGFGSRYFDDANTVKEKPYGLVNAMFGVERQRLGFYIWSKNLLNRHYIDFENTVKGIAKDGSPVTVGMSVKYRF